MTKTTLNPNTFSCDIHIADQKGTALLGGTVRTRNVMTGCAGASADEAAAKGVDIAADPRGYGDNELVYVVVNELCGCCGGAGRVSKMRGKRRVPFAYVDCKACKGAGFWYAGKTLSVVNVQAA